MIKRKYPIFVLLSLIVFGLLAKFIGLTINDTSSMPKGLYIKQSEEIERGGVVSFCLAEPYKTIGLNHLYIEKGKTCGNAVALIKKVIAIPGDTVFLSDNFIKVNNTIYQYKTKYRDNCNRPLVIYPRGTYKKIGGYWVIGVSDENSWDSRYFGEIKKEQIIAKLKPIVTW